MVVQAAFIGEGIGLSGERQPERFLGACLADAAGHADKSRMAAPPPGAPKSGESAESVLDHQQRRVLRQGRGPMLDEGGCGTFGQRLADEVMAIKAGPLEGNEKIVAPKGAAVDRYALGHPPGRTQQAPLACRSGFSVAPQAARHARASTA